MSSIACCPAEVRSAAPQGAGRGAVPAAAGTLGTPVPIAQPQQHRPNCRQCAPAAPAAAPRGAAPSAARALQLSLIQEIIQQKASCRALYSTLTSNHAPPELYSLYSVIQRYTALYTIQLYSLYSIQRYTITLCGSMSGSICYLAHSNSVGTAKHYLHASFEITAR